MFNDAIYQRNLRRKEFLASLKGMTKDARKCMMNEYARHDGHGRIGEAKKAPKEGGNEAWRSLCE